MISKDVKQLIIVGVLILVLVFAVLSSFKKKPSKKRSAAAKPVAEAVAGVKTASPDPGISMDNKALTMQKQRADLEWGRDPFDMAVDKEFQLADLKLKGISFGADQQGYAFVNTEIVKKGDRVGDYEVIEIEKDKVLLRKAGQSFYLAFPPE